VPLLKLSLWCFCKLLIWSCYSRASLGRMIYSLKILSISESKYVILKLISIIRLSYTSNSISWSICFLVNVIFFFLKLCKSFMKVCLCESVRYLKHFGVYHLLVHFSPDKSLDSWLDRVTFYFVIVMIICEIVKMSCYLYSVVR
jgi:hypothetical protein